MAKKLDKNIRKMHKRKEFTKKILNAIRINASTRIET